VDDHRLAVAGRQGFQSNNQDERERTMEMQTTQTRPINGVDVDALQKTIDAIKQTPGIATVKFRLHNEWVDRGQNRSNVKSF